MDGNTAAATVSYAFTEVASSAGIFSSASAVLGSPPCILSARTVATTTTALGT